MMPVRVRAALWIILTAALLLIALLCPCVIFAQSGPVQLSLTPETLELSPGETGTVLILASNAATATQSSRPVSITLTAFTGAGVSHRLLVDAERRVPPPGGGVTWTMEIAAPASGVSPGALYVAAEYSQGEAGSPVTRTVTARLNITARPAEAARDVLTATLHSDIETLFDTRERNAILVLTNISNVPVTVTEIITTLTSTKPEQLSAEVAKVSSSPFTLAPQQAKEIPIKLVAGNAVESGKNLLVVRVDAEWRRGTLVRQGSTVVTKTFDAGVFGESAILTVVGIPALLLLPGLLMLVSYNIFYRTFRPPAGGATEPEVFSLKGDLALAKPRVWFWALGGSLLLFLFYPAISAPIFWALTGKRQAVRNLLTGYGFIDIVCLWMIAAAIGAFFAVIIAYAPLIREKLEQRRLAGLTPTERDDAAAVLKKLVGNGYRDFVTETAAYNNQVVHRLPAAITVTGKAWVAPAIKAVRGPWADKAPKSFMSDFQAVDAAIREGGGEAGLRRLREWMRNDWVDLVFDQAGALKKPTLVDAASLTASGQGEQSILNTFAMTG